MEQFAFRKIRIDDVTSFGIADIGIREQFTDALINGFDRCVCRTVTAYEQVAFVCVRTNDRDLAKFL